MAPLEEGELDFESQVQVIHEPAHFYEQLLNRSATARKVEHGTQSYSSNDFLQLQRVVLSALYLGVGPKEVELVSKLKGNLASNPNLRVNFLLDCCRGRWGSPLCYYQPDSDSLLPAGWYLAAPHAH